MEVTALLVKELREKTGAGMMDCKKALVENDGDIEKAVVWLREKGITKAEKKQTRIAAEGTCQVVVKGNKAYLFEVNIETDFAAKNEKFTNLVKYIGDIISSNDAKNTEEALNVVVDGKTLQEHLLEATATIGEKITLRRVSCYEKTDDQVYGIYKHMGGKILVVAILNGSDEVVGKNICMQICSMSPKYRSMEDIPAADLETERTIIFNEAMNENATAAKPKPEEIVKKMVEGRLNKSLKEVCLLSQNYVIQSDITVEQYLKQNKMSVVTYTRLAVGEDIEKKVSDFAAEVQAQMNM